MSHGPKIGMKGLTCFELEGLSSAFLMQREGRRKRRKRRGRRKRGRGKVRFASGLLSLLCFSSYSGYESHPEPAVALPGRARSRHSQMS